MKFLYAIVLSLLVFPAWADSSFFGIIDKVSPEGEEIIISGKSYKLTHQTIVLVNDHVISIDDLEEGFKISYTLSFKASTKTLAKIVLKVSDKVSASLLNH